ncbi:MAG TPA: hydrogenase nickel incorporation protein HypB [Candidatus Methylomirabilis sp.]|nr:hydrogenase nickel incorporation protein HypB [Candidatus Methylomirabilis sp.]
MCNTCGCGDTKFLPVEVQERLLAVNDRMAAHNRAHFARHGVLAVNLMGSPGAGKTALLEATARAAGAARRLAAITGDLETDRDALRLRAAGIPAEAITTGSACHLDADMICHALHRGAARGADTVFIENVGNLVCPAIYDLGQAAIVVALSVTEGEDKPLKYPVMFRKADLVLLTKVDLLLALPDFDRGALEEALARVMPAPRLLEVSARSGTGIAEWVAFLEARRGEAAEAAASRAVRETDQFTMRGA